MQTKVIYNSMVLWIIHHFRACIYGFGDLVRAPLSSMMTIAVIGVTLSLPVGFYLLLQNFRVISKPWHNAPTISLYLKQNIAQDQITPLMQQLKENPTIKNVRYISPQEGLEELKKMAAVGDLVSATETNPLPSVLVVTPVKNSQTPAHLQNLVEQLQKITAVDTVQLDIAWIKRLSYLISIGNRIFYLLALLFSIGVMLIVGNTIRLTTENHRQEIIILKLVGATNGFIRRPLLYRGLMYGFFGGCVAALLVGIMLWCLASPAQHLAQTYGSAFTLSGLSWKIAGNILLSAALLGLFGSWAAVQKHLTHP